MPKTKERSFRYQERSFDDTRKRADAKGDFDSIFKPKYKRYKMRDGKNLIRVLPPTWDKARHYGIDIYVNYGIGPDNQSYLSLSKMNGEDDPLAEARREASTEGDEDTVKALNPRKRVVYWVIDRMDEDEGPQLFDAPMTIETSLANLAADPDTKELIMIDHPVKGCDFRFYKTGTGLKTDYDASKMKLLPRSPLSEDEKTEDEWLAYIDDNPLPDCLNFYSYDHIKEVFGGSVRKRTEDDEDKPRRGRSRDTDDDADTKKTARRARDTEDDDAPQERTRKRPADDEDDTPPKRRPRDEDEDAPPKRRARDDDAADEKPRKRSRDAEDDEPPFEADEKPARKRSRDAEPEEDPVEEDRPRGGKGESVSDRLARRRSASSRDNDDD